MLAALTSSALFLISYVIYHLNVLSKPFEGQGPVRYVYFTILISHIILAATIVPLVIVTTVRALKANFVRHRAIAKITYPLWMYVSVTGVVSAAQVFDTVYALTGGGPAGRTDLVAHRIYAEAFGAAAIGRAAVMAIVLFVVLVGVTLVQHLYFRKRISYDLT